MPGHCVWVHKFIPANLMPDYQIITLDVQIHNIVVTVGNIIMYEIQMSTPSAYYSTIACICTNFLQSNGAYVLFYTATAFSPPRML